MRTGAEMKVLSSKNTYSSTYILLLLLMAISLHG
ncbi:MAG: hypothetical protein ACI96N_002543 [Arenicella sp.]